MLHIERAFKAFRLLLCIQPVKAEHKHSILKSFHGNVFKLSNQDFSNSIRCCWRTKSSALNQRGFGRGSKKADFRSRPQHKSGHRYQWPSQLIEPVFTLSRSA